MERKEFSIIGGGVFFPFMGFCIHDKIFLIYKLIGYDSESFLNDFNNSSSGVVSSVFIGSLALRIITFSYLFLNSFKAFPLLTNCLCAVFFLAVMSQSQWITKSGGKMVETTKPKLKISVPRFDNTELIARYANSVIGRCMNPPKQEMKNLLFMLPRFWNVEGRVIGYDLGLGRFRFDFDQEEDIGAVLKMEPFHFDHWTVSIVRWKPVLEPNYPSKITFWVRVLDVPMQFWAPSTFQGVGEALGLVKGEVDVREGRVRVELDGFKPLVFSMEVDFDEGVELEVNLRYERLVGYCKLCCRMTHDQSRCPTKVAEMEAKETVGSRSDQGQTAMSYKGALGSGGVSAMAPEELQRCAWFRWSSEFCCREFLKNILICTTVNGTQKYYSMVLR